MSQVTPEKAQGLDSQTFLTALAINAGILFVELAAFVILKHRLSRIYEPRSYLPPPEYVLALCRARCTDAFRVGNGLSTCRAGHGNGCWLLLQCLQRMWCVYSFLSFNFRYHDAPCSCTRTAWTRTCSSDSCACS